MTTKASSDFGLYLDKKRPKVTVKLVLVLAATLLLCFGILFALVHLVSHEDVLENTLEPPIGEQLVLAESMKRETQNVAPKPFGLTFRGQIPSEFSSNTMPTPSYHHRPIRRPQATRQYPSSIQDVIGYGKAAPVPLHPRPQSSMYQIYQDHDPFYLYKPKDPGDVNLLATGNVRFAPPVWSNLKNPYPRVYPQQETTNRKEVYNHMGYYPAMKPPNGVKPITLTLNIYPNKENGEVMGEVVRPGGVGLKEALYHKLGELGSKLRLPVNRPRTMVIHLNLYPDMFVSGESKVKKRVVATPQPLSTTLKSFT